MHWLPTPPLALCMLQTPTTEFADTTSRTCLTRHCMDQVYMCELSLISAPFRIEEDHPIMSFTVSRNGRNALLNIANQVCVLLAVWLSIYPHVSGCSRVGFE